jgi:SAM-dependent methyltransferase
MKIIVLLGLDLGEITINGEHEQQDGFYDDFYAELMGTGVVSKVWRFIHLTMEKPFKNKKETRVLEIGSGNGEHFKYTSSNIDSYFATDIRIDILRKSLGLKPNVVVEMQDVCSLKYEDGFFDRVIMTCVLVHLSDPITALNEIRRVTKFGGYFSLYIPCEPGIILRGIRKISTHSKAKRLGVKNITYLHFLEHRNYFLAMDYFVRSVFSEDLIKARYYPIPFLSWNFNLFRLYTIQIKPE